jgi:hypothetical protein
MSKQSLVKRVSLSVVVASLFVGSQAFADELPGMQEGMLVGGGVPGTTAKAVTTVAGDESPADRYGVREGILVGGNHDRQATTAQGFVGDDAAGKDLWFSDPKPTQLGTTEGILVGGNAPYHAGNRDDTQRTAASN